MNLSEKREAEIRAGWLKYDGDISKVVFYRNACRDLLAALDAERERVKALEAILRDVPCVCGVKPIHWTTKEHFAKCPRLYIDNAAKEQSR